MNEANVWIQEAKQQAEGLKAPKSPIDAPPEDTKK